MCIKTSLFLLVIMVGQCCGPVGSGSISVSCQSLTLPSNKDMPPPTTAMLMCTIEESGFSEQGLLMVEWRTPSNLTLDSNSTHSKFNVYQISVGSNSSLTILNISKLSYEDEGVYVCMVNRTFSNTSFSSSHFSSRTVHLKLLTSLNASIVVSPDKKNAELSCEMAYYLQPDTHLSWYRNNVSVDSSDNKNITFFQGSRLDGQIGGEMNTHTRLSVLRIEPVMSGDSGVYVCGVMGLGGSTAQPLTLQGPITDPTLSGAGPIAGVAAACTFVLLLLIAIAVLIVLLARRRHTNSKSFNTALQAITSKESQRQVSGEVATTDVSASYEAQSVSYELITGVSDLVTSPNVSYGRAGPSHKDSDTPELSDPLYESIKSAHHYAIARPPDDNDDLDYYVNEGLGPRSQHIST